MSNTQSRVFKLKEQFKNIYYGSKAFVLLKSSKRKNIISKKFKEQIMLSITEVNGCTMCSFMHTQIALNSGMSREEIKLILDGNTNNIPLEDAVAVLFAQNFAYEKENVNDEAIRRIIEEYGIEKSELILAACNMITMTNGMGTSLDHLWKRLKFQRNKDSYLVSEIFNPLFTIMLFPPLVFYFVLYNLFKKIRFIKKSLITN